MKTLAPQLSALVFDYGNTLVEFGPDQVAQCDRALSDALREMFGPHDFQRLCEIQHHERRSPYAGEFRENDLVEITRGLVRKLFATDPSDEQIQRLLDVRFEAMTSAVQCDTHVLDLLERLAKRYRLGLISNYPCSRSIKHSLQQHGLNEFFDSVVVSGDIGHVKPHPKLFEVVLKQLDVPPTATLFVGDNWLGDIQGAKRCGMKAAWTTQYVPYELFHKQPGDHEADVVIQHILDLDGLLAVD